MYPDWLIRSLEGVQSIFRLPAGTILGVEFDTIIHFILTLAIVALAVERMHPRVGIGIAVGLALVKEALDVGILAHYNDVPRFLPDIVIDLLAAAFAIGAGVWLGRAMLARQKAHDEP